VEDFRSVLCCVIQSQLVCWSALFDEKSASTAHSERRRFVEARQSAARVARAPKPRRRLWAPPGRRANAGPWRCDARVVAPPRACRWSLTVGCV